MNARFSQQDRQGRLSTVLGADTLVLLRMDGTEELSDDFEWRVEALSTDATLDLHSLLGTHATVEIDHANGTRAFDGIICEAEARGPSENGNRYDLALRPWLHVASLRRNMRIFHNKTVIQIVVEVLSAYTHLGSPHLDVRGTDDYPVLEYTTQYGESDADFVRRQLERHGISWSWRHEVGSHTLLLTDAEFSLPEVLGGQRPYYGIDGYHQHDEEHFRVWAPAERITTGAVRLTEYNFKNPNAAQEVDQVGGAQHPNGEIESYDWPGDYLNHNEGRGVVNRRTDSERGQAPRHRAEGDVVSLGAGWGVTLGGDEVPNATGRRFVCLKAEHRFRAQAYGSGDSGNDEQPYEGSYVLMPDDTPFRPERRIVGPRVQGPETAVVVGDGEIDCDEHGRILCRFHWDLEGANTMRVRVSQNWASKGWGGMVIPRIGMEVIVEHLRGDPDKPIVTGCVYNGANRPPYALPEHKTRSTFKTDTHQGTGFNELRFEDDNGLEEIYLRAEKDMSVRVRENRVQHVGGTDIKLVRHDSKEAVFGDYSNRVLGDAVISIGSSAADNDLQDFLSLGEDNLRDPLLNKPNSLFDSPKAGGLLSIIAKGMVTLASRASIMLRASKSVRAHAAKDVQLEAGADIDLTAARDIDITSTKSTSLRSGRDVYVNTDNIRLVMTKDGDLHIRGKSLHLDARGDIKLRAGGDIDMKASGNVIVKGSKVKLN